MIFLADKLSDSFNLNIEVKEHDDEIIFLRKIKKGGASKSYGIQVAEMAGLPYKVIIRSKQLLNEFMDNKQKDLKSIDKGLDTEQLALFKEQNKILRKIKKIDIDKLSPIDALNLLNELINDLS